ncbi:5998_t:CDS:2 [Funneliformis caledonium]|uniref:5998_t:CDS:1 n=1 Tax=Funneliformis caledonium TaxID=1117310 RepID=A0A9N9AKQ3_9GLOM|nr:5998_t:CDS:2 [Funneliformis caledonium]
MLCVFSAIGYVTEANTVTAILLRLTNKWIQVMYILLMENLYGIKPNNGPQELQFNITTSYQINIDTNNTLEQ